MPTRTGGDLPDPVDTETEYFGKALIPNTVGDLGPNDRSPLEPHEKLRLGYLTGQELDPLAPREEGFMGGVDSSNPEHPELEDFIPENYRSEDYLD